jgi:hypothetical protein
MNLDHMPIRKHPALAGISMTTGATEVRIDISGAISEGSGRKTVGRKRLK